MVIREADGERVLESMVWGFPLHLKGMKPDSKPKPVNNIADLSKPMWIGLAMKPQGRCLIPLTGFAEPAGPKGAKAGTWVTVKGQPIFPWGGLWRESAEWGLSIQGRWPTATKRYGRSMIECRSCCTPTNMSNGCADRSKISSPSRSAAFPMTSSRYSPRLQI
jgi:putative SOS response-associated peptidase YedK